MSKRAVDEFLMPECENFQNVEDANMRDVSDDELKIDVSHETFDTSVPLVIGVQYQGNCCLRSRPVDPDVVCPSVS